MLVAISLLAVCIGTVLGEYRALDIEMAEGLFEKFIMDHQRNYQSHHEKRFRFEIFKENLHKINSYNREYNNNVMGINHFSDLSGEEFKKKHVGCTFPRMGSSNCTRGRNNRRSLNQKPPASFDWREHGVVTPVKNQGGCGACWAFSTIANVESQYALKHRVQLDLSEQQLLDCDKSNTGCNGGYTEKAILNLMHEGGVMLEKDYQYEAENGECLFDDQKVKAKVTGCLDFSGADDETIKSILVNYGPLSVALGGKYMHKYHHGILQKCDSHIGHTLLLVGYGTYERTKVPYWIIKNSWAEHWGEHGYLRLERGNPDCEFGKHMLVTSQVA